MADATQALEARVTVLEAQVHHRLLILAACGAMLSEIRRDDEEEA
jgi:hypothetical protein